MSRKPSARRKSRKPRKKDSGARRTTAALRLPKPRKSLGCDIQSADESKTGFSNLPRELRDMIYTFALTPKWGMEISLNRVSGLGLTHRLALNILATCKAVHREAVPILYGKNNFQIDTRDTSYDIFADGSDRKICELGLKGTQEWREEASRPGLATSLRLLPAKYINMIRTWTVAYHPAPPQSMCACWGPHAWRGATGALHFKLKLLPRTPFYTRNVSSDDFSPRVLRRVQRPFFDLVFPYVDSQFIGRALRGLARRDVLDLVDAVHSAYVLSGVPPGDQSDGWFDHATDALTEQHVVEVLQRSRLKRPSCTLLRPDVSTSESR